MTEQELTKLLDEKTYDMCVIGDIAEGVKSIMETMFEGNTEAVAICAALERIINIVEANI